MQKTFIIIALLVAGMSLNAATKDKKKDKKKVETAQTTRLVSVQDSVSYAAGVATTNGLLPYLQQEFELSDTQLNNFVAALKEAATQVKSPEFKAKLAGATIAKMIDNRILPQEKAFFAETSSPINEELFMRGFVAGVQNDTTIYTVEQATELIQERKQAIKIEKDKATIEKNKAWLSENAKKEGVKTTASGLQYKVITQGTGTIPQTTDKVTVKYEGKTIDGNVFDSSYKRNPQTTSFQCNQVIKGWTEALTMMPVGSKWELYIPQELAYGERQAGKIQPYSTLIFTVELVGIEQPTQPTATKATTK